MSLGWHFEQWGYSGGANAAAFRNALAGAGIRLSELLSRELVQNSVDAVADPGLPVHLVFRKKRHEGPSMDSLISALSIAGPGSPSERRGLLSPGEDGVEFEGFFKRPLDSLIIEDFNTAGLSGTHEPIPLEREDNYYRLCMELGGTKEFEHQRGGTYGYGKSVAWVASHLWTVILYSRFTPSNRSEGASARFLVVSWFKDHVHDGRRFTGRAWFGRLQTEGNESYAGALVDDDAHRLAERVGFAKRGPAATGLSLMLLGADLSLDDIKDGVERSWWPRLLDGRLVVELGNDVKAEPRENDGLQRYIRCWDLLEEQEEETESDVVSLESYKGARLGRLALTTHVDPQQEQPSEHERTRIAMIRGPGMVVQYHHGPFIQQGHPQVEGAFLADAGMDELLAKAEPPAHNLWDSETTRTDRPLTERERRLITKLYDKVNSRTRTFLNEQREPPPTPPERCRQLELLLGRYLRTERDKPTVVRSASPFSIRYVEQPQNIVGEGRAFVDAKAVLKLSGNAEEREYLCKVSSWIETVVEHGKKGVSLEMDYMSLTDSRGDAQIGTIDGRATSANCVLEGDEEITIDLRSLPLPHPDYRVRFILQVTEDI